ncbi:MAG: hypothetical protein IPL51_10085 [Candidatus Competibacteraceae bacterium]|nr:hypothetical protein [Candidatus Competibacteraceae bacterium]
MALIIRWATPPVGLWKGVAERIARELWRYRRLGESVRRLADGSLLRIKVSSNGTIKLFMAGAAVARYQFFGSLERLYRDFQDPSLKGRLLPRGCAVAVDQNRDKAICTPLVSSVIAPSGERKWPYSGNPSLTDRHLRSSPFHQPDGAGFRQWYAAAEPPVKPPAKPPKRAPKWVMTTWQQARPCAGFGAYSGGSAAAFDAVDLGYDRAPTLFSGNRGARKAPRGADWYGQACLREVEGRRFVVMVDAQNVFYCYPTGGYEPATGPPTHPGESGNVPASAIKTRKCPWPDWVTDEPCGQKALDAGEGRETVRNRLRPLWAFNRAGTRAVCVAAGRRSAWSDGYWSSEVRDNAGALLFRALEDTPGIVEVELGVTVTGSGPEAFEFRVALAPGSGTPANELAPVAAGYLLRPYRDFPADTLVVLDYRHFTDIEALEPYDGVFPAGYVPGAHPPLFKLRRPVKATKARVMARGADGEWNGVRDWLAYYAAYPTRYDPRPFGPHIEDFPELEAYRGQPDYVQHFTYICQVNAMDLGALAFCLSPTVKTIGDVRSPDNHFLTYGAEAAGAVTVVWGEDVERVWLGHPLLRATCEALFDRTAEFLDDETLKPLHCGATASGHPSAYGWQGDTELETATRFQWLLLADGANAPPPARLVANADEPGLLDFDAIRHNPALAGADAVSAPRIFSYFDGFPVVRPGLRHTRDGVLQPGESSFGGYPLGALHHASVIFLTLNALNALGNRFAVHPDGSWAIFAGPFAARSKLALYADNGVPAPLPDLAFEQGVTDRIVLVTARETGEGRFSTTETVTAETTHAEALERAFALDKAPRYLFDLRVDGASVEFRPASDDPGAQPWSAAVTLAPLGVGWTTQGYIRRRWTNEFCFGSDFIERKPSLNYSPLTTFPTPRMESGFAGAPP